MNLEDDPFQIISSNITSCATSFLEQPTSAGFFVVRGKRCDQKQAKDFLRLYGITIMGRGMQGIGSSQPVSICKSVNLLLSSRLEAILPQGQGGRNKVVTIPYY